MTQSFAAPAGVSLGDPAPWFGAHLQRRRVAPSRQCRPLGRPIVLSRVVVATRTGRVPRAGFRNSAASPKTRWSAMPCSPHQPTRSPAYCRRRCRALRPGHCQNYDGAVTRLYGAKGMPHVPSFLDPMLRAVAIVPWDHPNGHAAVVKQIVGSLPDVDLAAGAPITAPALIVPRVFDFDLCDFLVRALRQDRRRGFGLPARRRRQDRHGRRPSAQTPPRSSHCRADPARRMRTPIVKRLPPLIEALAHFQFSATRMDLLSRLVLRQQRGRLFQSPSRQSQRRRRASALRRLDQSQSRL